MRLIHLKHAHPTIFVAYLKSTGKGFELEVLYISPQTVTADNMPWYIHIDLLPKLTKMRRDGKLLHNQKTTIKIDRNLYQYTGDTELDGTVTGWGVAIHEEWQQTYTGTWLSNELEGIIISTSPGKKLIEERF